ncbi:MAG TPA: O-antigen ligase family protein, partial [Clostridia bacterium]|nr:O-antigen ligase family protein [Clostridia bacterium]
AFLALIASAVLSLPLMLRAGLKFKHIAIVVVVLAAVLLLLPDEMVSANTVLLMERINQPDFDRFDIYRLAWNAFLENPLLGVGPGQIVNLTAALSIDSIRLTAHNFVLNSLSELGLVGAIPYFALVGLVVVRTYRLAAKTLTAVPLGLWVGLLATMLANIVDVPFAGQHYLALFCTVAALVKLLSRDFQDEAITPQAEAKGTV